MNENTTTQMQTVRRTMPGNVLGVAEQHPDGGDDDAAERDLNQRGAHRDLEEALTDPGDRGQLDRDHDVGDLQRGGEVADQERQRVRGAADERGDARDRAARDRFPAAGQRAVVRQRLRQAHRDRGAERGGDAHEQRRARAGDVGGGEDRRQRRERAVDQPDQPGLDDLQHPRPIVRLAPAGERDVGEHRRTFYRNYLAITSNVLQLGHPNMPGEATPKYHRPWPPEEVVAETVPAPSAPPYD